MNVRTFKLHYRVQSGGDGSAHPRFHSSEAEAELAEEQHDEETGEPWGESSVGSLELKIDDDGRLYRMSRDSDYKPVWVEVAGID